MISVNTTFLLVFLLSALRALVCLGLGVFLSFYRKKSLQILPLSAIFVTIGLVYLINSFFRLPSIHTVDTYHTISYFTLIFIAPFTIFYLWFIMSETRKIGRFLVHFIPLIVLVLLFIVVNFFEKESIPHCNSIVDIFGFAHQYTWHVYFYITLIAVFLLQVFFYFGIALCKTFSVMKTYRKHNLSMHSLKLILMMASIFFLYALAEIVFLSFTNNIYVEIIHNILVLIFITALAILNLKLVLPIQTNFDFMFDDKLKIKHTYGASVSSDLNEEGDEERPNNQKISKDASLNVVDESGGSELLKLQLKMLMEDQEIFRQPQLTLNDLVAKLNSNRSYVSVAINKHCGCNFKQLLIHYRIEAAKKLLLYSELDIQSIYEQAGFNSRISFYRAFKENVSEDLSPTEWRKQSAI